MTKLSGVLRMSFKAGIAAGALVLASAGGANAQFFGFRYDYGYGEPYSYWGPHYRRPPVVLDELEPREIVAALEARGFTRISRPIYRDEVAIVRAVNPGGRPVRLTIDIFTGRVIDREIDRREPLEERRPQVTQRAPGQGPAIRDAVPEIAPPARAAPEPRPEIRREPLVPKQSAPPAPRNDRIVRPEKPAPAAKPPEAAVGTKQQPRRIDIVPPAPLDAPPAPTPKASEPLNSVPPAPLE